MMGLAALLALVVVVAGGALGYAGYQLSRRYPAPPTGIVRATAPERVAHGEQLFRAVCADCHTPGGGESRPLGRWIADAPAFLGRFYSRNLTADPVAGIGALSDEDLARAIRYGVGADGRLMVVMPHFGQMGDDDVAAVIGFLRSGHRDLAPEPTAQPPCRATWVGKLILVFVVGLEVDATGSVPTPAKAPTVEYGHYVADALYQCGYCHTPGFDGKKSQKPGIYSGGFELVDPQGKPVLTANLTPHATGIQAWSLADFTHAVRDGIRPDGTVVRPAMPLMRRLDDVEIAAVYAYLRSIPPIDHAIPRPPAAPGNRPEHLFTSLGCSTCHAPGAPFHDRLKQSIERPTVEVAAWIRNPQVSRPNTQMPTYAAVLDEAGAVQLAEWLQRKAKLEQGR
jgi:mono/diheme cytochrome c family protein